MNDSTRFHSLDVVRAVALLAGVVLHATLSFWPGFREAKWPISDESSSDFLAVVFFVIHIFRMSLFFAIAGFFAHLLVQRLGDWGFIKNRLRRIALPLIVGLCVVGPLLIVPFLWARNKLGIAGMPDIAPPIPDPRMPPWGHLWFLYLLLVLYALWLAIRGVMRIVDRGGSWARRGQRAMDALMTSGMAPLVLAAPVAALLVASPWWIMWQGIPAPIMGLIPNLPAVAAYGSALAFGWLLYRRLPWLELLKARWPVYLAAAVILSAISLWLVGIRPQLKVHSMEPTARAIYAVTYLTGGWCWIFALTGLAQRFFAEPNPGWRYVSDASFFVYIIHLPVVYLLQAWMIQWPVHWSLKFLLIVTLTFAVVFGMYHYLVRSTFVGQFLNGRRHQRISKRAPLEPI
jgi:glucan biosynthesis protein C